MSTGASSGGGELTAGRTFPLSESLGAVKGSVEGLQYLLSICKASVSIDTVLRAETTLYHDAALSLLSHSSIAAILHADAVL